MQASCCCCSFSPAPPRNLPQRLHLGIYRLPNQKTLASEIRGLHALEVVAVQVICHSTPALTRCCWEQAQAFTLSSGSLYKTVDSSGVALTQGMGSS